MKKETKMIEIYNNGDPAGLVPESELVRLSDDKSGGALTITTSSWVCGATVAISMAFCPTTKCTSKCSF